MVAYILTALIILAATAAIVGKQRTDLKRRTISLTAGVSLAASVLAFPYFHSRIGDLFVSSLKSLRYGFIEMLSMNVEPDVINTIDASGLTLTVYTVLLYVLYAVGPLSASLFFASFSRSFSEWFSLLTHRKIHIFSELNPRTVVIAESLCSEHPRDLLLFCNDNDEDDSDLTLRAIKAGAVLTRKNECDLPHSTKKEYEFYEIGHDIGKVLTDTSNLCGALIKKKNYIPSKTTVRYSVSSDNLELARNLDLSFGSRIRLRPLDENDSTALNMFRKYSVSLTRPGHHDIVIAGGGQLGRSILTMSVNMLIQPDSSFTVHYLSDKACSEASHLKASAPGILNRSLEQYFTSAPEGKNYDIRFYDTDPSGSETLDILSSIKDPDLVCVCSDDDFRNYRLAQSVKRLYASLNPDLAIPMIACCIRDGALNEILVPESGIDLFGNEADLYSYETIIDPDLEDEARRVHLSYLASSEPDALKQPAYIQEQILTDTGFYNYVNLQASLFCALALEYRRAYILNKKEPDDTRDDAVFVRGWLGDPENLELLGNAEHLRWNAYQRFQGWRPASAAQTESIARS
ncbi:MAG: hypothetical protein II464_04540, partial [Oscillospiraceae bacterium]|nr:hypothetical protein [Oscillospiraceae bacterium]